MYKIILFCLLALGMNAQVSRNRLTIPAYGWSQRVVPIKDKWDSTSASFYNKVDDANAIWKTNGNAVITNTNFIGTTSNRSVLLKTADTVRVKIDSVGTFNWNKGISNFRLKEFVPGIPFMHFGTVTPTANNYMIAKVTPDLYINSEADSASMTFTRGNGSYYIQCNGNGLRNKALGCIIFRNTDRAVDAGVNQDAFEFVHQYPFIWKTGAVPTEYGFQSTSQECRAVGASTMTDNYAIFAKKATAGTNMTIKNLWGFGTDGGAHITGSMVVGSAVHTPGATMDITGKIKMVDGNQASGYVLTSDANGLGTWQAASGGGGGSSLPLNQIAVGSGTSLVGSNYFIRDTSSGRVIVGNKNTGNLNQYDLDVNTMLCIARTIPSSSLNSHGINDASVNTNTYNLNAYNSFRSNVKFSSGATHDHYSLMEMNTDLTNSTTVNQIYGQYNYLSIDAGSSCTARYGLHMIDYGGAGTLGYQTGIYIDGLSKATQNYAIDILNNDIRTGGNVRLKTNSGAAGALTPQFSFYHANSFKTGYIVSKLNANSSQISLFCSGTALNAGNEIFIADGDDGTGTGIGNSILTPAKVRIGSGTVYPSANLDVTGTASISSTATVGALVISNGSEAVYAGSVSQVGTSTTAFTVTIGTTMANTNYKVNVTSTSLLGAAPYYISSKTTTTFVVTYLSGLTGTLTFDWMIAP